MMWVERHEDREIKKSKSENVRPDKEKQRN